MGVPSSEVGWSAAMPRTEVHEVHKDMWWHWTKKKYLTETWNCLFSFSSITHRDVLCKQKGSWGAGGWLSNPCMLKGNTVHRHRLPCSHNLRRWNRQNIPKRRHIQFRRRGITQKKEYNIHNMTKVWNQERRSLPSRNTRNVLYIFFICLNICMLTDGD